MHDHVRIWHHQSSPCQKYRGVHECEQARLSLMVIQCLCAGIESFFHCAWCQYASSTEIGKKGLSTECEAVQTQLLPGFGAAFIQMWKIWQQTVSNITLHTSCWHMAHFLLPIYFFFHRGGSHKGERGQRGNICQLHELKSRKLLVSSSGCKQCCSDNKVHFWTTSNCLISSLM